MILTHIGALPGCSGALRNNPSHHTVKNYNES